MRFDEWVRTQPRGTLERVKREARCSGMTIWRLKQRQTINDYAMAKRISAATSGAVSVAELCDSDAIAEAESMGAEASL